MTTVKKKKHPTPQRTEWVYTYLSLVNNSISSEQLKKENPFAYRTAKVFFKNLGIPLSKIRWREKAKWDSVNPLKDLPKSVTEIQPLPPETK